MADAEIAPKLQSLHAGAERRGSNASQTGDGCLEALWQQIAALYAAVGRSQVDALADAVSERFKESAATRGADAKKRWKKKEQ